MGNCFNKINTNFSENETNQEVVVVDNNVAENQEIVVVENNVVENQEVVENNVVKNQIVENE